MATKRTKGKSGASKKGNAAKKPPKAAKAAPRAGKAKATAKAKPAAKPVAARAKTVARPSVDAATSATATLEKLAARWPAVSGAEIEAFDSLCSTSQCEDLGKRTKSADVRDEAVRWAIQMDGAMRAYPGALSAYSPKRFAYFLHAVHSLALEIEIESGRRQRIGTLQTAAENAREAALKARGQTIERLATFAGNRATEKATLARAIGSAETNDLLARSLRALAHLEVEWLELMDPASKVLASAAGLLQNDADELQALALSFSSRASEASMEGRRAFTDTPTINRIEGRVLFEMREARRIFGAAHEVSSVVPKLQAGRALRAVFGSHTTKPAAAQAPAAESNDAADAATDGVATSPA